MNKLIATLLLAAAVCVPARADHHMEGMKEGKGGREAQLKKKLGLDDAQAEKVKKAMEGHHAAVELLRRRQRDGMTKLGDQLKDKAPDAKIKDTLQDLDSAHKLLQAEQEKLKSTLALILTPTQQAKMLIGMRGRGMMGKGMGKGMGGPRRGNKEHDGHDGH